jgi:uncharacterized protein (TIGR02117 family)
MRRWVRRAAIAFLLIVVVFVAAGALTMRRGDYRLYPPQPGTATVPIFLVSHGYHSGVVLPRARMADLASERGDVALTAVAARFGLFPFIEIGWGEEGFYRSVPTIASLTVAMAVRALFAPGNPSVLHVVGLSAHPAVAFPRADIIAPALSVEGFGRLIDRIDRTFAPGPRGEAVEDLGPGLYGPSLFYRAVGTFNILHVCNHWTADLLDAAGIPTAPFLATMPQGLFLDLQWRAGLEPLAHPIEAAK